MKFFPAIAWCHFWIALHYLNIRRRCDLVEYYRWWFLYFDTFWGNLIDFNQELNQQSNRCKDQQASPGLLLYDPQQKRRFSPLCLLGSASDACSTDAGVIGSYLLWMWRCRLPLRSPWRTSISGLPWFLLRIVPYTRVTLARSASP